MRTKIDFKKIVFIACAIIAAAAALIVLFGAHSVYVLNKQFGNNYPELALPTAPNDEPYNILLLGFDKRPNWKNFRTDAMLLLRVDPMKDKIWLLSMPRDYKVSIPRVGEAKLGQAFLFGGINQCIETVSYLIEMPINYVVTLDFNSFAAIVDALGGVEVDVPMAIYDIEADATKGNKAARISAGKQTLDGNHALTFVRSRKYADADFSRMNSQRIFLKALYRKFGISSLYKKFLAIKSVAPYLKTNMRLSDAVRTVRDIDAINSNELIVRELPGTWQYPMVIPDIDGMAAVLDEIR